MNFFIKLFLLEEWFFLEKGLKFVLMFISILYKNIVFEIEVVICYFFDIFKDVVRISFVVILYRVRLLVYKNIFKEERKVLNDFKKD